MGGCSGLGFISQQGCDKSKQGIIKVMNSIVAQSMVDALNSCSVGTRIQQNVSIFCNPVSYEQKGQIYEDNIACRTCQDQVFLGLQEQHRKEYERLKRLTNVADIRIQTPIDDEYQLLLDRLAKCGINHCKACVLDDINQVGTSSTFAQCASTTNVQPQFASSMQSAMKAQLTNNQDVLSSLVTAFNNSDANQIVNDVTSQISAKLYSRLVTKIQGQVSANQFIQATSENSVRLSHISQNVSFNMVLNLVQNENIVSLLNLDSQLDTMATLVDNRTTLNNVGELVFGSVITVVSTLDSILGQIILFTCIGLACLLLIGLIIIVIKQRKQTSSDSNSNPLDWSGKKNVSDIVIPVRF